MEKRLYKTDYNKMLDGVCNGLAEYFNMDVTIVRILFALAGFGSAGTGIIVYIVLAVVMPKKMY